MAPAFVWYELATSDVGAACAFYGAVVGLQARPAGETHPHYTILSAGETMVAGAMALPPGGDARWIGYVPVADADAAAARVAAAGGAVHHAPDDIPGVGRFAVVADPQGASFVLFAAADPSMRPDPAGMVPGRVGWHELSTADSEAAFAFYAGQFGWERGEAIPMGELGLYRIFHAGGMATGGMMTASAPGIRPAWLFYFSVPALDAALAAVRAAGGQVLNGPMEVPGGAWVAQARDPQGAAFALVAPAR